MAFAIASLLLSMVAVTAALWPLLTRARRPLDDSLAAERATLRAAIGENERDRVAGRIEPAEADAARAELGRRLLALGRGDAEGPGMQRDGLAVVPVALALLVPLGGYGLYAALGSPTLPDLPIAARTPQAPAAPETRGELVALLARAEATLAENPDDTRGWAAVAPVYRSLGRMDEARNAYRRALPGLVGSAHSRALTELADLDAAAKGALGEAEAALLSEAVALDPSNAKADILLLASRDLGLDRKEAAAAWRALLDRHDALAGPMRDFAARRLAAIEAGPRVAATSSAGPGLTPAPGPSPAPGTVPAGVDPEAAAAVASLPEAERRERIEVMVSSLASRLADDPDDAEGWERLIRSYAVMERPEDAAAALARAEATFADDDEVTVRLAALARELDIAPEERR